MKILATGLTRAGLGLHLYEVGAEVGSAIAGRSLCRGHVIPRPNTKVPMIVGVGGCVLCFRKAAKLGYREFQDPYTWFDLDPDGTCRERPREYFLKVTSEEDLIDLDNGWCWEWVGGTDYCHEDDHTYPRPLDALLEVGFRLVKISSLEPERLAEIRAQYFADDAAERD